MKGSKTSFNFDDIDKLGEEIGLTADEVEESIEILIAE